MVTTDTAIITLIADLQAQILALREENTALRAQLSAALETEPPS